MGYRWMWILEVIWNLYASIMSNQLRSSITLNNALHCYRRGRVIELETLEAKLSQQLAGLCHDPLFQVFLYVLKSW